MTTRRTRETQAIRHGVWVATTGDMSRMKAITAASDPKSVFQAAEQMIRAAAANSIDAVVPRS